MIGEGPYHKRRLVCSFWVWSMCAVRVHALERAPSIAFLRLHQAQLAPVGRGLPADCERISLRPA